MNKLAEELNGVLEGQAAGRLLSDFGRRIYFPKGIIAQSGEAKKLAKFADATIGMACKDGRPSHLSAIAYNLPTLSAEETVAYAPTAGVEKLRKMWLERICQKNPALQAGGSNAARNISLPVVVPGITAGISYTCELFLDEKSTMISSDPCWDNYRLIFSERRGARVLGIPFFPKNAAHTDGLDIAGIRAAILSEAEKGAVRLILNFPNNPSGYSPTTQEARALLGAIREAAEKGADVLALCDDAYFGLFYEDNIYPQSLFAELSSLHERVLAVKLDGPIKEEYAWGFRTAFVTFGGKGLTSAHYDALVTKLTGVIRSSVSCSNTASQYLLLKVSGDSRTSAEKDAYDEILYERYLTVKKFISENPPSPVLEPFPFNSGYFMCFHTKVDAELLRQKLLTEQGIGLVALGTDCLRLAFSSIDQGKIPEVCRKIYETAAALS
jgi:aspartate/methionine/tyrosine aminotransferase